MGVRLPTSKKTIKKQTVENMKALGVYKSEYDLLIDLYAEIVEEYQAIQKKFKEAGYPYEVDTPGGGKKKSPMATQLETLRKDMLAYADRLCITPRAEARKKPGKPKKQSALADALAGLDG